MWSNKVGRQNDRATKKAKVIAWKLLDYGMSTWGYEILHDKFSKPDVRLKGLWSLERKGVSNG